MEFDLATALMPFRFGFMQNAFAISIIVSVPTALLSCFLVLKGWALMGDAISHAILPGIVLAHLIGAPLILGAFGAVCRRGAHAENFSRPPIPPRKAPFRGLQLKGNNDR